MSLYSVLAQPFADYMFMRRALVACMALAISGAPVGVLLVLRRMTLVGDAMSHAVLPGAAIAFLAFGLSLWPMTLGGLLAALLVASAAGALSRYTDMKEDSSFAGAYLMSLSAGELIIALGGNSIDLVHILFGNVLAVNAPALAMVVSVASVSTLLMAVLYRSLVMCSFDEGYMRSLRSPAGLLHQLFPLLVVLNLVAAFQTLGTLLAMGVMVLPAVAARFWKRNIDLMVGASTAIAAGASFVGLLLSFHFNLPCGPAIVLTAGGINILSALFGRHGSLLARRTPERSHAL